MLEGQGLEYMIIGGFALPSYGPIRTTLDLDVAVRLDGAQAFDSFVRAAERARFSPGIVSFANPVATFTDGRTGLEVEFWLRPDGVAWDQETLGRRRRVKTGSAEPWLISPEDFIVSKLSRPDRGVQDEMDVRGVLTRLAGSIDREYLERRARDADVLGLLLAIGAPRG